MIPFLADADQSRLVGLLLPIIVITLSMGIPIAAIITEHLRKQKRMELMAKAIEHGADPSTLDLEEEAPRPPLPYRSGMVCLAVGLALAIGGRYLDFGVGGLHFPFVLGGYVVGAIGIALLVNDYINRSHFHDQQST